MRVVINEPEVMMSPRIKPTRRNIRFSRKDLSKNTKMLTRKSSDLLIRKKQVSFSRMATNTKVQTVKSTYLLVVSIIFFSLTLLFIKILNHGRDIVKHASSTTNFFCGFYMCVFSLLFIKIDNVDIPFKIKHSMDFDYLLIRCFCGFLSILLTIKALNQMRLVSAITLIYLSPVLTTYFLMKQKMEQIKKVDKVCHVLSLIIILCFVLQDFSYGNLNETSSFDDSMEGITYSLIVAVLNSVNSILDRKILYEFHTYSILFVTGLFSVIVSPLLIALRSDVFNVNWTNFVLFFLLGSCCFFGFYFTHKSVEANSLLNYSSLNYVTIVLVYFYSFVVLDEPFTLTDILASCCAILVNYYTKIRMEDCENEDN